MDNKRGKVVTYRDGFPPNGFPPIKSLNPFNTRSREIIIQIKNIPTAVMPRTNKLGRRVIYHEKLPPIKFHGRLIMFP